MMQTDLFAAGAEDSSVQDTTWLPHYGPWLGWEWEPCNGPHPKWEDLRAFCTDEEDVEVYRDKKGFRARVHVVRDSFTNLWLGNIHVDHPTGGGGGPSSYSPAAYRTREDCIAAWKVRALERLEKYRKRHEEELAWRDKWRKQCAADRMDHVAQMLDESDDTGEEGMVERFADEPEDLDVEGDG